MTLRTVLERRVSIKRLIQISKKVSLAFAILLVAFLLDGQAAFAHAVLVISEPAANAILEVAPKAVTIEFSEPVAPTLSQIVVLSQGGQAVTVGALQTVGSQDTTATVSLPALADGIYLVSWQVLSTVDGHTTSGSFSFGVGVAELSATTEAASVTVQLSPWSIAARWLTLTGLALLLGLFVYRLFVWNPILEDEAVSVEEQELDRKFAQSTLTIGVGGAVLVAVGLLLTLVAQFNTYNLLQFENLRAWVSTTFGNIWLGRLMVMVLYAFLLLGLRRNKLRQLRIRWEWLGFGLGLCLALTSSLISHSAALTQGTLLAISVDLAHTLAAGVWAGGLVYLAVALWQTRRLSPESRTWFNLNLNINFSALGALAVGILLTSGGFLGWQHVGSWAALVSTPYGLALLAKIGLAVPAFAIAAINLLVIKPRLNAAYEDDEYAAAMPQMRRFSRLVPLEVLFALLVLVAAGLLTDLQRGADAPFLADAPGKLVLSQAVDELSVAMTLEPALVGPNSFDVYLTDASGQPVIDANEVSLRFTFLGRSIGAASGVAASQGDGHYELEGSYVGVVGSWQIEVAIRRPNAFDAFAPFRVEAGVGGSIQSLTEQPGLLARFVKWMTLIGKAVAGAVMILLAIGWFVLAAQVSVRTWHMLALGALSVLILWSGAFQLYNFFDQEYTPGKFVTNPVLPDAESIAVGERLYQENCSGCHGPAGLGDGPAGVTLFPPPANFTAGHTAGHSDGDIFYWIRNGVESTAMPAFDEQFSRTEVWHLVNYVRRLSVQSPQLSNQQ